MVEIWKVNLRSTTVRQNQIISIDNLYEKKTIVARNALNRQLTLSASFIGDPQPGQVVQRR